MVVAATPTSKTVSAGRPHRNDHAPSLCSMSQDWKNSTRCSIGRLAGGTTAAVIGGKSTQPTAVSDSRCAASARLLQTSSSEFVPETNHSVSDRKQRSSRKKRRAFGTSGTLLNVTISAEGRAAFSAPAVRPVPVRMSTSRCRSALSRLTFSRNALARALSLEHSVSKLAFPRGSLRAESRQPRSLDNVPGPCVQKKCFRFDIGCESPNAPANTSSCGRVTWSATLMSSGWLSKTNEVRLGNSS
mmetsp:Transcript_21750/g.67570  ORF Transcript_21750/g.67570 Transcript_21750/m.67570 type:complete len:244 (-) Transcript_21750:97-828(-)